MRIHAPSCSCYGPCMGSTPPQGPRGRFFTTLATARDPYGSTERWRAEFGRTFRSHVMTGEYVVTGEPEVVRDVFRTDPGFLLPTGEVLEPLLGTRSLFSLDPAEHARERKLLMPPFHGSRMRAYAGTVRATAERRSSGWTPGTTVRALDECRSISAEVIVRAVFGVQDEERVGRYLALIARWVNAWKPVFILFPFTQKKLFGLSPWARFVAAGAELDQMLEEDITERRTSGERGEDILSLLLDSTYEDGSPLTNTSIRSHLRTLLFGGHETTMIAIAWTLHFLHADPAALERTRAVIDAPLEQLMQDEWLDAVVQEAVRPRPIILGITRELGEAATLGGYDVPAGSRLFISIAMLHTDPELYPEPHRFRPERFLEKKPKPWEYLPFGGGHRRCLGAAFAQFEAKIVVATFLSLMRFELVGPKSLATVRRNLSMAPASGVPLRVTERLA